MEGEDPLYYGSRCEKYDVERKKSSERGEGLPNLFAETCNFAAQQDPQGVQALHTRITSLKNKTPEINTTERALSLYLRQSQADEVKSEAQQAVEEGVSRTFLAHLLIT